MLLMLQGHAVESWTQPALRVSETFRNSQFLGGLPAPIFLFMVGASLALVIDRMRAKGIARTEQVRKILRRSVWILLLAYAFRLEQFLVWYPASQWSDLLRVDTLNCIAVATLICGVAATWIQDRLKAALAMAAIAITVSFATPLVFTFGGLPWLALSYLNGAGNSYYFSLFPWIGFAFAGLAVGYVLMEGRSRGAESLFMDRIAALGVGAVALGWALDGLSWFRYGFFDYSVTSPQYFLVRLGWLSLILWCSYRWSCREAASRWSPLVVMGQSSLLIYWLHIEIVYGPWVSSLGRSLQLSGVALHLAWMVPLMVALAALRQQGVASITRSLQRLWSRPAAEEEPDQAAA